MHPLVTSAIFVGRGSHIGQGAQRFLIHISCLNGLKVFYNSDTIPDTREAILRSVLAAQIRPPPFQWLSPMGQNMHFQIMLKKNSEFLSYPKLHLK